MNKTSRIQPNFWGWVALLILIAAALIALASQIAREQGQFSEMKAVMALLPPTPGSILVDEFSSSKLGQLLIARFYSTESSTTSVKDHYRNEFNKRGYQFLGERSESETGAFTLYYCSQSFGNSFDIEVDYKPSQILPATYTVSLNKRHGLEFSSVKGIRIGIGCA